MIGSSIVVASVALPCSIRTFGEIDDADWIAASASSLRFCCNNRSPYQNQAVPKVESAAIAR